MNTYRLSSPAERIVALLISGILLLCMVFLLVLFCGEVLSFIVCLVASVMVAAALVFYLVNLFKAACIVEAGSCSLLVRGIPNWNVDLSDATSLKTQACENGPVASRTLIFCNEQGDVTATVPTFFTTNRGVQAEPLAQQLAEALDLAFVPTVEVWEYDKLARKAHQQELDAASKAARKAKLAALKKKIFRTMEVHETAPVIPEKKVSVRNDADPKISDGINYDALDDEN